MKRHSLLFALFIFLSSLSIQAEGTAGKWSERYNVTAITMDEGLPHNFVDDILKDSQGFLWIATRGEGIARYDGYEFTAFNMGSTHTKLRSNFINKLCEDNFKRIWAVSEMGIDILDIQTMQTVQVADTKDKLISLCNRPSHLILHSMDKLQRRYLPHQRIGYGSTGTHIHFICPAITRCVHTSNLPERK